MLSELSKDFIRRLPFARVGTPLPKFGEDHVAQENARKCEERFGMPQKVYCEVADLVRGHLLTPVAVGAFMAGLAVGWHERSNHKEEQPVRSHGGNKRGS